MSKPEIKPKKSSQEIKTERQKRAKAAISVLHQKYKTMNSQNLHNHFVENPQDWNDYHNISKNNEESFPEEEIPRYDDDLVLVLDGVRDPGNLGTILRTADWFGVSKLICSLDCVDVFNHKVVQATMGSIFRVNVFYYDLGTEISKIRKYHPLKPVYGATLEGENVYEMALPQDAILVVGSEANGISKKTKELLTKEIKIPRFGSVESLNVGSATAVLCSEFKRR